MPDWCLSNLKLLEELMTVLSSGERGASDKISLTRKHAGQVRVRSGYKEPSSSPGGIHSSKPNCTSLGHLHKGAVQVLPCSSLPGNDDFLPVRARSRLEEYVRQSALKALVVVC